MLFGILHLRTFTLPSVQEKVSSACNSRRTRVDVSIRSTLLTYLLHPSLPYPTHSSLYICRAAHAAGFCVQSKSRVFRSCRETKGFGLMGQNRECRAQVLCLIAERGHGIEIHESESSKDREMCVLCSTLLCSPVIVLYSTGRVQW